MHCLLTRLLRIRDVDLALVIDRHLVRCCGDVLVLCRIQCSLYCCCDHHRMGCSVHVVSRRSLCLLQVQRYAAAVLCRQVGCKRCIFRADREAAACVTGHFSRAGRFCVQLELRAAQRHSVLVFLCDRDGIVLCLLTGLLCVSISSFRRSNLHTGIRTVFHNSHYLGFRRNHDAITAYINLRIISSGILSNSIISKRKIPKYYLRLSYSCRNSHFNILRICRCCQFSTSNVVIRSVLNNREFECFRRTKRKASDGLFNL